MPDQLICLHFHVSWSLSYNPTLAYSTFMMRITAAILAATAFVPMSAYAGMYGDPVMNLDAKDFKKAMATEHAAVGTVSFYWNKAHGADGSIRSTMVWSL